MLVLTTTLLVSCPTGTTSLDMSTSAMAVTVPLAFLKYSVPRAWTIPLLEDNGFVRESSWGG